MATNAEVATKLGVSHSTVSRMRTGKRVGSPEVLQRIAREYSLPLDDVMSAAVDARAGKTKKWVKMMTGILKTEEPSA